MKRGREETRDEQKEGTRPKIARMVRNRKAVLPKDHPDTGVECGFYGIPSRAYRNQFGMAEYARVELP